MSYSNVLRSVQEVLVLDALFNLQGIDKMYLRSEEESGAPNKAQRSGFDGERRNKDTDEQFMLA